MDHAPELHSTFWPRGRRVAAIKPLSPRLAGLNGKKLAFLWDYVFRGDEIFPIIARELKARFPDVSFIDYEAFGSTHGENERQMLADLPARLKELGADAVISGMGC